MRTWWLQISAVLLLVSTGCRTLVPSSAGHMAPLDDQDRKTAQALAHFGQGLLYEVQQGPSSPAAFDHYAAAAQLVPGERIVASRVALSALHRKRPHEAIPYLQAACEANPDDIDTWIDLAAAYRLTGQLDPALAAYRRAIAIDPTVTPVYLAIAVILIAEARESEALASLATAHARADRPLLIEAFVQAHAKRLLEQGRNEASIACFERLVQWDEPQRASYYQILAELHLNAGRTKQSLASFEAAWVAHALTASESHDPEHSEIFYLRYAAVCEYAGQLDRAVDLLEAGLIVYPESHRVLNFLAYTWAVQNTQLERALQYAQQALTLDAENPAYLDTRGWIHYRMGAFDDALADIRQALASYGNEAEILTHLGAIQAARGETALAIQAWQAAVRHGTPGTPAVLSAADALRQHDAPVPPAAATPTPPDAGR